MADLEIDGANSKAKINKVETDSGSTLTLGQSGDTVTLGSGATLGSVFDPSQSVTWSSTIITTATTLVSGNGYFVNTTSGAITVTLPASPSVGDYLQIKDYAGTFGTNNLTIARNGSNIQGNANDSTISTNRAALKLVYADATKGWLYVEESNVGDLEGPTFITATGGTVTTDGDFKVHTFTSSGTFTVSSLGNPIGGPNTVEYLVVAGGGGGGFDNAGGGGAGGFRTNYPSSPGFSVSAQAYPITVGSGGAGRSGDRNAPGASGGNSIFSSFTSAGGGGGGSDANGPSGTGSDGGSGGGGAKGGNAKAGGSGNTPSVSPPQGNPGGSGAPYPPSGGSGGGGGGGASASGQNGPEASPVGGGAGGDGTANSITGSSVTRAGGGGGGSPDAPGAGGAGGGGNGGSSPTNNKSAGTANTGGGGGGGTGSGDIGANGGSGVVIIRYKFQ